MADVTLTFGGKDEDATRAIRRLQQEVGRLKGEMARTAEESVRGSKQQAAGIEDITRATHFLMGALGVGGVLGAVHKIIEAYDQWRERAHKIAEEARTGLDAVTAFMALQPPEVAQRRYQDVQQMAVRYGVTDVRQAFDLVQALQSQLGDYRKGLTAAEAVFRGAQVGIPMELGQELEVLGIGTGQAPGEAIRRAFIAGQASGRTPQQLAPAIPGVAAFETEPVLGWAAAAILSGAFPGEQLPTYTLRAAEALGPTGGIQRRLREEGAVAGPISREETLRIARQRGLTGEALQMEEWGITEERSQRAMRVLLKPDVLDRTLALAERIPQLAVPGVLEMARAQMEAGTATGPLFTRERMLRQVEAAQAYEGILMPGAARAMDREIVERRRGLVAQRRGLRDEAWFDAWEGGRPSMFDQFQTWLFAREEGGWLPSNIARGQYLDELRQTEKEFSFLNETMRELTEQQRRIATRPVAPVTTNTGEQ